MLVALEGAQKLGQKTLCFVHTNINNPEIYLKISAGLVPGARARMAVPIINSAWLTSCPWPLICKTSTSGGPETPSKQKKMVVEPLSALLGLMEVGTGHGLPERLG